MNNWLATIPTTNLRIIVSITLAVIYVVSVLVGVFFGKFVDTGAINTLALFLLAMMGLDVAQFIGKRFTDTEYIAAKATPPVIVDDAGHINTPAQTDPGSTPLPP